VLVAIAGVPGAPEPLALMVILLTPAGTVQVTLGGLVEEVVKMILAGNWPWIVEMIVSIFSTAAQGLNPVSVCPTILHQYASAIG